MDALYDAYEQDGTVPTRRAFAEACPDEEIAGAVASMKRDPFAKSTGKRVVEAVVAGLALVAVVGGCVYISTTGVADDTGTDTPFEFELAPAEDVTEEE